MSEQKLGGGLLVKDRGMVAGETESEGGYLEGRRRAWMNMLSQAAEELGYDDPLASAAARVVEREETVAALREVCAEHGDNDWPDNLHLADVVRKRLGNHLGGPSAETEEGDALALEAAIERMRAEFEDGDLLAEMADIKRRFDDAETHGIDTRAELELVLITMGIRPSMGAWQRVFAAEASGPTFDVEQALVRLAREVDREADAHGYMSDDLRARQHRIAAAVKVGVRDERDFTLLLLGLGYVATSAAWARIMDLKTSEES